MTSPLGIAMEFSCFDTSIDAFTPLPGHALGIPEGHVGPYILGSGRIVYWTGRVAIGLRHQAARRADETLSHGAAWIQAMMLRSRTPSPTWAC